MSTTLVLASLSLLAATAPASFTLTIPATKDRIAVEATYTVSEPYLEMWEGWYSDGVDGGLAGFIEDLAVTRDDGTPVVVGKLQDARWKIDAPAGETVIVKYNVRLNHETKRWPFGSDEIAYVRGDSLFLVSRTALVVNESVR